MEKDVKDAGITFQEAMAAAQERKTWRGLELALCGPDRPTAAVK